MATIDPDSLRIVNYPDPALREKTREVDPADPQVRAVAERMVVLMHAADGVGLAAPQVGLPWRLFVADVPPAEDRSLSDTPATCTSGPVVYINPKLSDPQGRPEPASEGCLSLPGISGDVLRPPEITIEAVGLDGKAFRATGAGLLARCWQHEFDHLEGVLIIDKFSQMSRLRNRSAVRELERAGGR